MKTFAEVQELHDQLYGRYLADRAGELAHPEALTQDAGQLIRDMQEIAPGIESLEEYQWLLDAADRWRNVFVCALGQPRDIALPRPQGPLKAPEPRKSESMVWGSGDLEQWIRHRAFSLAVERAQRRLFTMSAAQLLAEAPASKEEQDLDWKLASLYLAREILSGGIGLSQLRSDGYPWLEVCWLEDLKQLQAYMLWLAREDRDNPAHAEDDFLEACNYLHLQIQAVDGKRPRTEFAPVRRYLENSYLTDGRLDAEKSRRLIARKAIRLAERPGSSDLENWLAAERYCKQFYDHVLPAVSGDDPAAARKVADLVDVCGAAGDGTYLIINAFEAAITAMFVPAGQAVLQQARAAAAAAGAGAATAGNKAG